MFMWPFGKKEKKHLGIDLGSSSIKVVELEKKGGRVFLSNYALIQTKEEAVFNISELKDEEIAKLLKHLFEQAGIVGGRASFSLSVEKTFSTVINLPAMPESELAAAIPFEAQKYVPLPLNEVVLDWTVITNEPNRGTSKRGEVDAAKISDGQSVEAAAANQGGDGLQVLLLAVSKDIVNRVTKIARLANLELSAIEQESFSLIRSLVGNDKGAFLVVDLGRKSVDLIIVDQGFIRVNHNFDSLNKEVLLMEADRIVNLFQMRYNKKVGQCLLAGGRAFEKDLFDFLSAKLKLPVKIGDPFARVGHNEKITDALAQIGPQFSVAVGLAMRDN
ncbi:MAG: pilus assembly protein PilM [Patescibacteria group bacterium]